MKSIDDYTKLLLKDKDLENPNSFEELGYIFLGPLLFNFFIWLKSEIKTDELILFNSREGYFLKEIYEIFKKKYNLPEGVYFKTSRKISTIVSIFDDTDIYKTFELHRYSGKISNLLNDRFGVSCDENYDVDSLKQIPNLDKYIDDILNNAKKVRMDYGKYIKNIIKDKTKIVMIDSGYQGTTQYNIQKAYGLQLRGRYINYKGNKNLSDVKGLYDFYKTNFQKNIIFFESIFTDKVGSYIDIIGDTFINEKIDLNNQYFKEKTEIINGIKKFIIDILQTDFDETNVSYEYADTIFNLMCVKNYIKNEKLFDIFFHDNYYVRDNVKKIVRQ
jgi:hypothetical protein